MARTESVRVLMEAAGVSDAGRSVSDLLALILERLAPGGGVPDQANTRLLEQLNQLSGVARSQAEAVAENTQAVVENTIARAVAGRAPALETAGRAALSIFGGGLGLSPLVTGLVRLFAGERRQELPPLVPYVRPEAVRFEAGVMRTAADGEPEQPRSQPLQAGPQITIQVQAMDSRSFLDHREEIARAVREAMLTSHSLNDVVNEL